VTDHVQLCRPAPNGAGMSGSTTARPDRRRLGLFAGVLVAAAAALVAAAELTGAGRVALAPVYMFSPLLAGAVVCWRSGVGLGQVGLRVGRPRWLVAAALVLVLLTLALAVAVPGVGFDAAADPVPGLALPAGPAGVAGASDGTPGDPGGSAEVTGAADGTGAPGLPTRGRTSSFPSCSVPSWRSTGSA